MGIDGRVELLRGLPVAAPVPDLLERLDSIRIDIVADEAHVELGLAIANLAARIWPDVRLDAPETQISAPPYGAGVAKDLADAIVSAVRPAPPREPRRILRIAVGVDARADIQVTADDWSLRVSRQAVARLDPKPGPAGLAAAALAVAELLRMAVPELPGVRLGSTSFDWNLVDYGTSLAATSPALEDVDATCFGAGSVGSSFALGLLMSRARGEVRFVDDDLLQPRNRLKYPLWFDARRGRKVDWVEAVAAGTELRVTPRFERAADYVAAADRPDRLVIAALDSPEARRDVADLLAYEVLDAGVDGLRFHVSRHHFADGCACSYCGYLDVTPALGEVGVYAELTGLADVRVAELLKGGRLSAADLAVIAATGRLDAESAGDLIGGRIQDVARGLYASARVPPLGSPWRRRSCQPWLAPCWQPKYSSRLNSEWTAE